MLYAYSNLLNAHSKYSRSNISMNPSFLCPVLGFFVAPAISWRRQVLLYAHSKCLGKCSMRIQNKAGASLFYQIGA
jgi:hypothetical protein